MITAIDLAGNRTTSTFPCEVHAVSATNLIAAVNDGVATGKIAPVFQVPLVALLTAAQAAINRGLYGLARAILSAFEALVRAVRGGGIVPSYADLPVAWSSDLRALP